MSFKDFVNKPTKRGRPVLYKTEEERLAARKVSAQKWRAAHPDYQREYYLKQRGKNEQV